MHDSSDNIKARRRSEALAKSPVEALISVDSQRSVISWNTGAARIFGYDASEIISQPVTQLVPEHLRLRYTNEIQAFFSTRYSDLSDHVFELEGERKSGDTFPAEVSILPWVSEGQTVFEIIARDVSDRVAAEYALTRQSYRLRKLAARLQETREEERARLSREVHDRLGQALTGLRMDIAVIESISGALEPEAQDRLDAMKNSIDETVETVRKIASDLRPGILDDLGIEAAIEWEVTEFTKRSGLGSTLVSDLSACSGRLDRSVATTLFRVLQELLTNIVRHANATNIAVELAGSAYRVTMTVEDDGDGFDTAILDDEKSLGLLGIEERLAVHKGNFAVYSEPGTGTRSEVSIPLSDDNLQALV